MMSAAEPGAPHASRRTDPLLAAGKLITVFLKVCLGIGFVAVLVALPALLLNQDAVAAELAKEGKNLAIGDLVKAAAMLLPLIAVMLGLAYRFVQLLGRMIDTVGEGDPFIPANAVRLRTMGWLSLAAQLLVFPIAGIAAWIERRVGDGSVSTDFDFDLSGVVLVIILFILARVFKRGAEMREELEGTV